jgi:hypothetical protein
MTAALPQEAAKRSPTQPLTSHATELAREAARAQQAMDGAPFGCFEYDEARRWRDTVRAQLTTALGGNRVTVVPLLYRLIWAGCKPKRPCLTFLPALRRVHRPEVV